MNMIARASLIRPLSLALGLAFIGSVSTASVAIAQKKLASDIKQMKIDLTGGSKARIGLGFTSGGRTVLEGTSVTCVNADGKKIKCPTTIIITSTPD